MKVKKIKGKVANRVS